MLAFILGSLLLKTNKTKSDHLILVWVILAILSQIGFYYVATGEYQKHIRFAQFTFGTLMLHAPLLYFYVRVQLEPNFVFTYKDLFHLTPIAIFYLLHIPEFSQNVGLSICSKHFGCYLSNKPCSIVYNFSKLFINSFYIMLAFFTYKDLYKPLNKRNTNEKVSYLWVKILLYIALSLNIFIIIYRLLEVGQIHIVPQHLFLINIISSLYILIFSFIGSNFTGILDFLKLIRKIVVFVNLKLSYNFGKETSEEDIAADLIDEQNAFGLSQQTIMTYVAKLNQVMEDKKPFLDHRLTRAKLSEITSIPSHHLAYVIKEEYFQTYTDFINSWRLELLLKKLEEPKYQNYTLLALAFECGFNSKSTFNRYFKSHLGTTPTEFLKLKHKSMEVDMAS